MKQWGDTKDDLYYITEFGALKRKQNESAIYFSKCFNKIYSKIPAEIKPSETSTKLTYANSFDSEFSLLWREKRHVSLLNMQEAALEVESNMLASSKLKDKSNYQVHDKKGKKEMMPLTSTRKSLGNKIDEMTKLIKNMFAKINRLEMENKNQNRPIQ